MLDVYFEHYRRGHVAPTEDGPTFSYSADWQGLRGAFPVSLTMPLGKAEVPPQIFSPTGGQPAAGGRAADRGRPPARCCARRCGRSPRADRAGHGGRALLRAPGSTSTADWHLVQGEAALERIIEELPRKPFLAGEDGVSMSLAGVQSKIAVAVDPAGEIYIPLDGSPSTHILKPDAENLWGSVENEAFCLALARRCGLSAPGFSTGARESAAICSSNATTAALRTGTGGESTRRISARRSPSLRRPNMSATRAECAVRPWST